MIEFRKLKIYALFSWVLSFWIILVRGYAEMLTIWWKQTVYLEPSCQRRTQKFFLFIYFYFSEEKISCENFFEGPDPIGLLVTPMQVAMVAEVSQWSGGLVFWNLIAVNDTAIIDILQWVYTEGIMVTLGV